MTLKRPPLTFTKSLMLRPNWSLARSSSPSFSLLEPSSPSFIEKKWTNSILQIYGPKLHSVIKQFVDPMAFSGDFWLDCVGRLAVATERVDEHPYESLALQRQLISYPEFAVIRSTATTFVGLLDAVRKVCIEHQSITGVELRPLQKGNQSTSASSSQPPPSCESQKICTFCSKKGHSEDRCWKKIPQLRQQQRTANQVCEKDEQEKWWTSRARRPVVV